MKNAKIRKSHQSNVLNFFLNVSVKNKKNQNTINQSTFNIGQEHYWYRIDSINIIIIIIMWKQCISYDNNNSY